MKKYTIGFTLVTLMSVATTFSSCGPVRTNANSKAASSTSDTQALSQSQGIKLTSYTLGLDSAPMVITWSAPSAAKNFKLQSCDTKVSGYCRDYLTITCDGACTFKDSWGETRSLINFSTTSTTGGISNYRIEDSTYDTLGDDQTPVITSF